MGGLGHIGLDLDEVLSEFYETLICYYNNTRGTSYVKEQFLTYNLWDTLGGTREGAVRLVHEFYETYYFQNIQPVEGSVDGVRELEDRYNLSVITARPLSWELETLIWLEKYFPNVFEGVHFAGIFSSDTIKSKAPLYKELNIDLVIEDNLECSFDCAELGMFVLLFDRLWNNAKMLPLNIIRVNSWEQIIEFI